MPKNALLLSKQLEYYQLIAAISAYASYEFITMTGDVPGAPENAGKLGGEHIFTHQCWYEYLVINLIFHFQIIK